MYLLSTEKLEYAVWLKMHFTFGLSSSYKSCSKKIELNIWVPNDSMGQIYFWVQH